MDNAPKVVAIVGTYRKGGMIDSAVDEILDAAREAGAVVSKVYLTDKHIEFCANCRHCTSQKGPQRGVCRIEDDMVSLLDRIDEADAFVLASPMNFDSVTAVTKRFIERLICLAYWAEGMLGPKPRYCKDKRALLVVSSAAPALMTRCMSHITGPMKTAARLLGAHPPRTLYIGLSALEQHPKLRERTKRKARRLGKKLVAGQ